MIIYQMEHELVVKQLYNGVDIYDHDLKSELFEGKSTFGNNFLHSIC